MAAEVVEDRGVGPREEIRQVHRLAGLRILLLDSFGDARDAGRIEQCDDRVVLQLATTSRIGKSVRRDAARCSNRRRSAIGADVVEQRRRIVQRVRREHLAVEQVERAALLGARDGVNGGEPPG